VRGRGQTSVRRSQARVTHARHACWRSAWEERARETRRNYKMDWPRTKVTICVDRSISPVDLSVWSILPWAFFSPQHLIRWTGDSGHLFRCVLALRQRPALHRLKLQPSVVAIRHHCAKSEELWIELGIKHQKAYPFAYYFEKSNKQKIVFKRFLFLNYKICIFLISLYYFAKFVFLFY